MPPGHCALSNNLLQWACGNVPARVCQETDRRLACFRGSESSVYIEIPLGKSVEGGMRLMSDFEMLSLVLMAFMVVVPLVVELIKNTKK